MCTLGKCATPGGDGNWERLGQLLMAESAFSGDWKVTFVGHLSPQLLRLGSFCFRPGPLFLVLTHFFGFCTHLAAFSLSGIALLGHHQVRLRQLILYLQQSHKYGSNNFNGIIIKTNPIMMMMIKDKDANGNNNSGSRVLLLEPNNSSAHSSQSLSSALTP